ncbi:hypothetical protein BV898_03391 [Hypsibius exemplaris]|uniref:Uncharacterized protein n=1 Tax=Hypsibius exemplaris TaxID=2072580 RepID=A0A1W0X594_HYPEX|nr:hypothetical protein BV898_03391 [Hypsibius exemplaris]
MVFETAGLNRCSTLRPMRDSLPFSWCVCGWEQVKPTTSPGFHSTSIITFRFGGFPAIQTGIKELSTSMKYTLHHASRSGPSVGTTTGIGQRIAPFAGS